MFLKDIENLAECFCCKFSKTAQKHVQDAVPPLRVCIGINTVHPADNRSKNTENLTEKNLKSEKKS